MCPLWWNHALTLTQLLRFKFNIWKVTQPHVYIHRYCIVIYNVLKHLQNMCHWSLKEFPCWPVMRFDRLIFITKGVMFLCVHGLQSLLRHWNLLKSPWTEELDIGGVIPMVRLEKIKSSMLFSVLSFLSVLFFTVNVWWTLHRLLSRMTCDFDLTWFWDVPYNLQLPIFTQDNF